MTKDDLKEWVDAVNDALVELASQDAGYPLGINEVREKAAAPEDLPPDLASLYAVFDGLSLPDVHVGYFIDRAARVASAASRGEPIRIAGEPAREIQVFGSDGGGGRFALGKRDGAVYYLPSSGAVRDGVFCEDQATRVRTIAGNISEFLQLLKLDIEGFVRDSENHKYIID